MELEKQIDIDDVDQLPKVASWVRNWIAEKGATIVAFFGEMGSGKTTLISEICTQEGVVQTPSSPTFALVNGYTTDDNRNIYHFDFYRIKRIEEAYDFGYEEYFYGGDLCLIEWPELIETLLPEDTLKIKIEAISEDKRIFSIVD